MDRIVSMYWDNIDPGVVATQAAVFRHLGLRIEQQDRTGTGHGDFLDDYMAGLDQDDLALFVDIDCFPLNRAIVDKAFAAARQGHVFGCAQSSNHIDPDRVFAAPMFLALSRSTWDRIGRPSFKEDGENDVAQRVTDIALAAGVSVEMLYPWACIIPKWRLGEIALFGVGTFYRGGVFHLFESRSSPYTFILSDVADAVLNDRAIDHLALVRKALPLYKNERSMVYWQRKEKKLRRRLTKWLGMIRHVPSLTMRKPVQR